MKKVKNNRSWRENSLRIGFFVFLMGSSSGYALKYYAPPTWGSYQIGDETKIPLITVDCEALGQGEDLFSNAILVIDKIKSLAEQAAEDFEKIKEQLPIAEDEHISLPTINDRSQLLKNLHHNLKDFIDKPLQGLETCLDRYLDAGARTDEQQRTLLQIAGMVRKIRVEVSPLKKFVNEMQKESEELLGEIEKEKGLLGISFSYKSTIDKLGKKLVDLRKLASESNHKDDLLDYQNDIENIIDYVNYIKQELDIIIQEEGMENFIGLNTFLKDKCEKVIEDAMNLTEAIDSKLASRWFRMKNWVRGALS
jgi:DNA repair ATPase RecN